MACHGSSANHRLRCFLSVTTEHVIWVSHHLFGYASVLNYWTAAEEVQNASINVPRAMFFTIFINGALGFATYIVIAFCIGNVENTLFSQTGSPFVQMFYDATQSKSGTTAMTSILIAMYICATFGFVASASRQAWAFARDNGLPGSNVLKRVRLLSLLCPHLS